MGILSLYIIMSKEDEDDLYEDDVDMLELDEKLPNTEAGATIEHDDEAISPLMFGPTGRGSPVMELRPDHMLFRDAAKVRRNEGFKDDKYLENPELVPFNEQQKKEAVEKRFDALIDNMYKEIKKPVAQSKAKSSSKKGGKRKRSSRRTRRSRSRKSTRRSRSRRSKRSSRRRR